MAQESKRGCGYRKVGGLYLVGDGMFVPCDRLPYLLETCPVCGHGIHFTRSMTEINPLKLFGTHDEIAETVTKTSRDTEIITNCKDKYRPCIVCDPPDDVAYIMMIGEKHYSPLSFKVEAQALGVSKRIPFIPKKLVLGKTIVYLAHNKAIPISLDPPIEKIITRGMLKGEVQYTNFEYKLGILCAFMPKRVEMPCWESQLKGKGSRKFKESLKKRGITPVSIKDGDKDHE